MKTVYFIRDLIGGRRKDKIGAPPVTGLMDTGNTSGVFTPDTRVTHNTCIKKFKI